MEQNTTQFKEEYGYWRDREQQLREIAGDLEDSLAIETANQIKHLKAALNDLVSITKIHSKATGNNFAWAELAEAERALGV